jgi:hypothetical protein
VKASGSLHVDSASMVNWSLGTASQLKVAASRQVLPAGQLRR